MYTNVTNIYIEFVKSSERYFSVHLCFYWLLLSQRLCSWNPVLYSWSFWCQPVWIFKIPYSYRYVLASKSVHYFLRLRASMEIRYQGVPKKNITQRETLASHQNIILLSKDIILIVWGEEKKLYSNNIQCYFFEYQTGESKKRSHSSKKNKTTVIIH